MVDIKWHLTMIVLQAYWQMFHSFTFFTDGSKELTVLISFYPAIELTLLNTSPETSTLPLRWSNRLIDCQPRHYCSFHSNHTKAPVKLFYLFSPGLSQCQRKNVCDKKGGALDWQKEKLSFRRSGTKNSLFSLYNTKKKIMKLLRLFKLRYPFENIQ